MPQLISESLRACEPDLRGVLMGNVVLTGGGTLFAGFGERLSNEMARNFPHVSYLVSLLAGVINPGFTQSDQNTRSWKPYRTAVRRVVGWQHSC